MGCRRSPYGAQVLYSHVGGIVVDLPLGDMACSGSIQFGKGTVVLEMAGSALVKVFSVPVKAHQEKEFLEDLIL